MRRKISFQRQNIFIVVFDHSHEKTTSDEEFALFVKYHLATCEKRENEYDTKGIGGEDRHISSRYK